MYAHFTGDSVKSDQVAVFKPIVLQQIYLDLSSSKSQQKHSLSHESDKIGNTKILVNMH